MKLDSDYSRAVVFNEIFSFLTLRECLYLCVPGLSFLYLDDEYLPSNYVYEPDFHCSQMKE